MPPLVLGRADGGPGSNGSNIPSSSIADLPESVLSQISTLAPPPGVTPNFINPVNTRTLLIVFASIGIFMILACAAIRLWVKIKLLPRPMKWAWSDMTFIVALLATLVTFSNMIVTVTGTGQFGIHQWDVPLSKMLSTHSLASIAIGSLMSPLSTSLIKITIFLTYIELFSSLTWVRRTCYIGIAITFAFYATVVVLTILWAFPLSVYLVPDDAIRSEKLSVPAGIVGLLTDIYLFLVPLIAVSSLKNMTIHKKIGIVMIFGTGFLAIISSILSIVWRAKINNGLDHNWDMVPLSIVIVTEQVFGIIIACTPHIAKFFRVYDFLFKAGTKIKYCICYRCGARKRRSSAEFEKSSGESDMAETPKPHKPTKLYPGLDVSTVGGTFDRTTGTSTMGTSPDKTDNEVQIEEVTTNNTQQSNT
ncbi:hypothetical protein DSL72_004484 [Monilinia vaccinii-corymbosi]|uniref:Rhodopsin domain-containing protein n=1 Tax=Monilinia vaccinii-corymbosi TaxID=61207 RepID=A0A8A3P3X5_9HELO|nr:hypothetical protein DSL72_004484 [Monilinia vaccinii-corymbosi]